MRKPPGALGLKKFGSGKLRVGKVWAYNIFIAFLAELDHSKKINFRFILDRVTERKSESVTNGLTCVGARDACASKKGKEQIY